MEKFFGLTRQAASLLFMPDEYGEMTKSKRDVIDRINTLLELTKTPRRKTR